MFTSDNALTALTELRSNIVNSITERLDQYEGKELDLFDCGLRMEIATDYDTVESAEVIGISYGMGKESDTIYLHGKRDTDSGEEVYDSRYIGELPLYELIALLKVMENYEEIEDTSN